MERLALGKLTEHQAAGISEHFFECDECDNRYTQTVNFVRGTRQAAAELKASPELRPWWTLPMVPRPAFAAGLALAGILAVSPRLLELRNQPAETVELQALRGSEVPAASAGRELRLRLQATGTDLPSARGQVAAADGRIVWTGTARLTSGKWELPSGIVLEPGQYWIRLLHPSSGEQLQEYGLLVR